LGTRAADAVPKRRVTAVLGHRRDEAARDIEREVAEVPERVLDVLAEDGEEEHVAEDVVPASVHEHRGEPLIPHGSGPLHALSTVHG
jgi:hypothetical protein